MRRRVIHVVYSAQRHRIGAPTTADRIQKRVPSLCHRCFLLRSARSPCRVRESHSCARPPPSASVARVPQGQPLVSHSNRNVLAIGAAAAAVRVLCKLPLSERHGRQSQGRECALYIRERATTRALAHLLLTHTRSSRSKNDRSARNWDSQRGVFVVCACVCRCASLTTTPRCFAHVAASASKGMALGTPRSFSKTPSPVAFSV